MTRNVCFAIVAIIIFISCSAFAMGPRPPKVVPSKFDEVFAEYPNFRIDNVVRRLIILGAGGGDSEITSSITDIFLKTGNIKIIEPGNLSQIIGGRLIEYNTGLKQSESQMLSQMLQVNHLLIYEEIRSPHSDYKFGGRAYVRLNIKIVNVITGEVLYQDAANIGNAYEDPRKYGYSGINERSTTEFSAMRRACMAKIAFKLKYAIGESIIGVNYSKTSGDTKISNVIVGSPAYKCGLKKGDVTRSVNGVRFNNYSDYINAINSIVIPQGSIVKIEYERDGKLNICETTIPIIKSIPEPGFDSPEKKELSI